MALKPDEVAMLEIVFSGCDEKHDELNDFESSFVESLKTRYDTYKDNMFVSTKQWGVIFRLYDKAMA